MWVGNVAIGGNAPIAVQSMSKIPATEIKKAIRQIKEIEEAGCDIIRIAVPDLKTAQAIKVIKKEILIPIVADIHFNYRLAIEAIRSGADKIRLNPGNIYRPEEVLAVIQEAKKKKIPVRIGVNSGSLNTVTSYQLPVTSLNLPQRMVEKTLNYLKIFEKMKFKDIVISLKTSDVFSTIESYELLAKKVDYPFHLGVTASGPVVPALVKSSLGIGTLLMDGIGDTIRVSLTSDPVNEVRAGHEILKSLGLKKGIDIISCPTCGRCRVNLVKMVNDFERSLCLDPRYNLYPGVKVALMGCEVNGPGEARDADVGVAFGKKDALFFKKGKPIKKINQKEVITTLLKNIRMA